MRSGRTLLWALALFVLAIAASGRAQAASACYYGLYGAGGLNVPGPSTMNGTAISGSGNSVATTGAQASASGVVLPALSPATFPGGGSTASVAANGTLAPGTYTTVTTAGNLVLQPGTYYINSLSLSGNLTINPSGVVVLNIGNTLQLGSNHSINGGGTPSNLQIYLYANAHLSTGSQLTLAAFIYSPFSSANIQFDDHLTLNGAILSGGGVTFGDTNTFTESAATQASFLALPACLSLVGQWHLEETSWNGTAGEVKDSGGYPGGPFNGQAVGNPLPVTATASPARAGSPGTCGYGALSSSNNGGGAFSFTGLPLSQTANAATSVALWMYWDGTLSGSPTVFGWPILNVYFDASGYFGVNTLNGDLYGIATTGLANGWHHLVFVFLNGNAEGTKMYVDGVLQSPHRIGGSPNNSGAYANSSLYFGGQAGYANWKFSGRLDELKIYNSALGQSDVTAVYNETHACAASGGTTVGAFAAYESATAPSTAYTGNINTKVAGLGYSLDVAALNTGKTAVNTSFAASVLVQVVGATIANPTLDANGCPSSGGPQTLASPGTVSITNGRTTVAFPAEANAWPYAKVKVSYPTTSPTVVSCSGDPYAIRPASLSISANDGACASPSCTLNNASTSGAPTHAAGSAFTLTASAYNGAATPALASNYPASGGAIAAASLAVVSPATVAGTLTPGAFSGSGGTVSSTTAAYSEAGSLTVQFQDSVFAAVDATESATPAAGITSPTTAASCSGYYTCSSTTTLGRFIPAHFAITPSAPTLACNGFTYFGQDFSTPFVITAQNASNATTQNYAGSLAKLGLSSWSGFVFSASGNPAGSTLSSGTTAPSGAWALGVASIGASQNLSVPATPSPPASVLILARPIDSDGVTLAAASAVTSSAETLYEGRARMFNAIGPETPDLYVPFRVEYWQSAVAGWQLNSADTCTTSSVAITSGTLAAASTCVRDSGSPGASGAGCAGTPPIANHRFLDGVASGTDANGVAGFAGNFNLWLKGPGAGNLGTVNLTATVPNWLQFNWTGTVGNPSAIATFGMSKGGPVIYRVEHY